MTAETLFTFLQSTAIGETVANVFYKTKITELTELMSKKTVN